MFDLRAHQYWQQKADYEINLEVDDEKQRIYGDEIITYTNNSPDVLSRVYYHLYFNAFQPESMMDIRTRNIADQDLRILNRLPYLTPEEIGYHKVKSLNKKPLKSKANPLDSE